MTKVVTTITKSGCLSHFSAFLTFSTNQGVGGSSPFQRTIKANTHLGVGFFVCYDQGREPERVAACKKQCGTLFLAARALRSKQGQSVCKAKPQQTASPFQRTIRTDIQKMSVLCFYAVFCPKTAKNNIKSPEITDFRAFLFITIKKFRNLDVALQCLKTP